MKLFDENKTLMGFNLRRLLFHQNQSEYVANIFDKVIGLWKNGKVKPVIDSTWAFEDVSIFFTQFSKPEHTKQKENDY